LLARGVFLVPAPSSTPPYLEKYGASHSLGRAAAGSYNPTKFSEVWTVASRNSLYQILVVNVALRAGRGLNVALPRPGTPKIGTTRVEIATVNFGELLFFPRTPVNKGIKRAGAATPRPSTTPFLALLHAEGFRHLRREVGVVVHYLPSVRFATVDVRHAPFDAYRLVSDSPPGHARSPRCTRHPRLWEPRPCRPAPLPPENACAACSQEAPTSSHPTIRPPDGCMALTSEPCDQICFGYPGPLAPLLV
jgi:hypothetical protein